MERVGFPYRPGYDRINQCGDNHRPDAVTFTCFSNAVAALFRLFQGVDEGDSFLLIGNVLELREQAMTDGFGGNAGAIGNEENSTH